MITNQQLGTLDFQTIEQEKTLLAVPVYEYLQAHGYDGTWVSKIDPDLADTATFCKQYNIDPGISANCVIVEAKRSYKTWWAACIILATTKADINGVIRKTLDARKVSFAPMSTAISLTHMEYGGITPIGLPTDWPILIDSQVIQHDQVIVGSGIRGSKILIASQKLQSLTNAQVLDIAK